MQDLKSDPRFASIEFKEEGHHSHAFQKIHVRVKPEIVHSSLRHIDPTQKTGAYMEPDEFKKVLK